MVIAWVGFASIGIFMARYMKTAFGEKVLLGTKMWFTVRSSAVRFSSLINGFRKMTFSGDALQNLEEL